jgi:hypothetical protein
MPEVEALIENISGINPYVRILIFNERLGRNNAE